MKKRIGSAILMAIIFIPVLLIGGISFTVFMSLIATLGMHELISVRSKKKKIPVLVQCCAYFLIIFSSIITYEQTVFSYTMDYHLISFIIMVFMLPILLSKNSDSYNVNDALYLIGSLLFINMAFNLILIVRNYDLTYLIYLLLITILTDTFAFLTGKYIGKNKLAPTISPNKTVEGFIGGLLMGTFVAVVFYNTVINPYTSLVMVILITMFLSVIGQLGDLVFSSIKRTYEVKDFSNLIPGHGGILDRFDSLIFVSLAFILVMGII